MLKDFFKSIKTYGFALKIISKLNLWKYFFIPAILGLLLGSIFIFTVYCLSDNLGAYIAQFWKFDFGKNFIIGLSTWLGGFAILILGLLLYKHILMALSAPFMTPVSEKVEAYLTGKPIPKTESKSVFIKQLFRSIRINVRNLLKELLVTIPLLLLSFIPVIGLVATVIIFYVQSYYTGFGNMDYTLERYLNYSESKKFVKKNRGIAVGNGLVFTLMLFIPLIGIMLTLPISTVAATINTVKKLELNKNLSTE
jgi:CysZ protein